MIWNLKAKKTKPERKPKADPAKEAFGKRRLLEYPLTSPYIYSHNLNEEKEGEEGGQKKEKEKT